MILISNEEFIAARKLDHYKYAWIYIERKRMRKRNCSLITVVTKGQYHFEFSKSLSESNIAFTQCKKVSDNFPFKARPLNDKAQHFDTSIFTCFTSLPQFTTRKKCFPTKTQPDTNTKQTNVFGCSFFSLHFLKHWMKEESRSSI